MPLRLFLESARHTRPHQLVARIRLTARRKCLERFPGLGDPRTMLPAAEVPPLAPSPPPPIFPRRSALATLRGNRPVARFLNRDYPLVPPIAWHDPDMETGTRLGNLNLHYMEYLEAVDDAALRSVLEDWIDHNPPYRRGYWLDDWNSYALSIRVVVWMQQWAAGRIDPGSTLAARVAASLARQLRFLERNIESDIGGNHILKNAKALLWAGSFFAGELARRWRELGSRVLEREIREQMLPDGMHFERSPAYHAQVVADLLECWTVVPEGTLREALVRALTGGAQILADLTHPDGMPSLFNDGGLTMTYSPTAIGEVLERVTAGRVFPRRVFAAADAGYFGARTDDELVLVDCGPIGPEHLPAHAHGDALAFEWSVGRRRVIVDTGVFEYNAGARRARSRSTAAHNSVTLDDHDQAEFWSAFRVGRRPRVLLHRFEPGPNGFLLEGSHDGYRHLPGAPRHVRRFTVAPGRIDIEDRVDGGRGQRARARLLLAPGLDIVRTDTGAVVLGGGVRMTLTTTAALSFVDAAWWPDFGVEVATRQIVLDYGSAPCTGRFVLDAAIKTA